METPPPLPSSSAPPPPLPQPQHRGWWARNWKWFVPTGCLTMMVLFAGFVTCIMLIVFSAMKSSDVYKTAVARAKSDERVQHALGRHIHDGMFPSGKTNVTGPSGEAELSIPISGSKGKGTIYLVATKSAGEWEFSKLIVKTADGDTIDLNRETDPDDEDDDLDDET